MGAIGLPGDLSSASRFAKVAFTKLNSVSNLAFPEIHTGKVKQNDVAEDNTDSTVVYDTVAVPEVHLKKHKHKKQKKDNK